MTIAIAIRHQGVVESPIPLRIDVMRLTRNVMMNPETIIFR